MNNHKILDIRFLTPDTFIMQFERKDLQFKAGQYITVGLPESRPREYSIYSGEDDQYLEILVKEITEGNVSLQLRTCKPGQHLEINGPFGFFKLDSGTMFRKKLIFIATGTGISPFHSFIKSYVGLDYLLLHGIRVSTETYGKEFYDPDRYISCTSDDINGDYHGRVTDFLKDMEVDDDMEFYLCGNSKMTGEVSRMLIKRDIRRSSIHSEVYF